MSFPSSPTNGQIAIINGITYTYSVAKSAWIRGTTFFVANTLTVAGDVTVVGNLSFGSNTANASFDASTVTSGIILPTGNSLQRPPNPLLGTMRFNSTYNALEVYTASGWTVMSPGTNPTVSNVQFTTNGVVNANVTAFSSTPQQILITGSGFLPPMTVLINGTSVFNTILNSTQILATITGSFNYGNLSVIVSPPLSATGTMKYTQAPIWNSANVANISVFETPSINLSSNVVLGPGDTATYTLTGGTLPTGTVLSPTGIISGHTTGYSANTAVPITVTATNSENQYNSQNIGLYVIVPTLTISPTTIGATTQLSAITPVNLIVSGGVAPYTFRANAMPAGLTLSSTGTISGTPLNPGAYAFIVTATDAYGYTTSQTFSGSNTPASITINYLIVAGGGGGASNWGGGGGAGGLIYSSIATTSGYNFTITVGAGGAGGGGDGTNGCNSSITGAPLTPTSYVAIGGGGGGSNQTGSSADSGKSGGSGGGGSGWPGGAAGGGGATQPSSPSGGFGNGGGSGSGGACQASAGGGGGAGGGGATATPNNGGAGGAGKQYSQYAPNYGVAPGSPSYTGAGWFAGGGGGGGNIGGGSGGPATAGGGGGNNYGGGGAGTSATGGGGGGGGPCGRGGGSGGSGIIILSYTSPIQRGVGGTVTGGPSGPIWYHAFTASGTYTT